MKFTLDGARTIVGLNLEEAREMAKYDHRTSEYWPTLIGERLWFLNMLNNIEAKPNSCEYWDSESHFCTLRRPQAESIKHGRWVKMSDADGIYYVCSECGNELPRVIDSFNPQFDLFPKLKCIDKTTYCPNCGAKMER